MRTRFVLNPLTGSLDLVNIATSGTSGSNFILNPNAEVDTSSWNLYNNAGRVTPASLLEQDLTFTSTLAGDVGNGVDIEYIYNASYPSSTPNVNVINSTHVQVRWNNGPTVANNPTATQLKTAWDLVPAALAIATVAITGTATNREYVTGHNYLSNGGDTAPTNGTGGVVSGLTFTRSTVNPIIGLASFLLSKDAVNREGQGVSTDFTIDNLDKGRVLEVSVDYDGSSGIVLGAASDVTVWIYDVVNSRMIPILPQNTLSGPTGTIHTFIGTFTASATSSQYRLILHISTQDATAWTLQFDGVTATDQVSTVTVQVPSVVLSLQPVSGAVTDRMCVMWRDGATQWVPATIAGAAIPAFGSDVTQLGFATNISGATADIYISGLMDGFSFGPFAGYEQYIDTLTGGISPLPSPFTDTYVPVGKAISATALNIQFNPHVSKIANSSGVPLKGGLLTNSGANDGTGDQVLTVGTNGQVPVAASGAALGIQWAAPIVATTPFTFTLATRTLTIATATDSLAGVLSAADHTTYTGYAASIALKAPLASPVFTGDVNVSTGNAKVSTLGKGLQVKTGVNSKIGTAVLVAGTKTVTNTSVTANSLILLTSQADGGTPGFVRVTAKTAATSFVITSSNPLDTSTIGWMIVELIP